MATTRPLRVLMLHHDPAGGHGGASHMAWRTADALAGRGHEVALAGTVPPAGRAPTGGGRTEAGRARRLGDRLPRNLAEAAAGAGWVPDVVHVTDLAYPDAAERGLALARSAGALFALSPATDPALWADGPAGRRLAAAADVVFALTPTERRALEGLGVAPDRLAHLGQGPQLGGRPEPARFRDRVGARGPLVLFLGRKLPTKGAQHLVAATPAILDRHPDATVVVAGPDPDAPARPRRAAAWRAFAAAGPHGGRALAALATGGLHDLGALGEADKHSALLAADVLCLPSVADAFPLAFVEAWWCRTPVVSGPFPGAREVVRHGVDGLVTTADAAGVAAAVLTLLDDPARRAAMAAAGLARARRELSWAAVAGDAELGYRRAALERRRAHPTTPTPT